jgi:hypothetical protein
MRHQLAGFSDLPPRVLLFFAILVIKLPLWWLSTSELFVRNPSAHMLPGFLWLIWFALLFLMAMPQTDQLLPSIFPLFRKTASVLSIAALLLAVIGGFSLVAPAAIARVTSQVPVLRQHEAWLNTTGILGGYVDSTALVHQASRNLVRGENPYQSANIVEALDGFNVLGDGPTPLRRGAFAESFPYPSTSLVKEVWDSTKAAPSSPLPAEFESKLCYPAGSFLVLAPFTLAGVTDMRLACLVLTLAALAVTILLLPKRFRLVFAIAALASMEIWFAIAFGETGPSFFAFVLLAWVLRKKHPWWAALLMGIAVTVKQQAWFLAPFFLIELYQTSGPRRLVKTASVIGGVFLVTNLPFLVQDPALWMNSVAAPMTDPLFPAGVGMVSLVTSGLLDIRSPLVFTFAEGAVLIGSLVWYFRNCGRYPNTAPLLAMLPLFFAWRSLSSYFMQMDILMLAGIMLGYNHLARPGEDAMARLQPEAADQDPRLKPAGPKIRLS